MNEISTTAAYVRNSDTPEEETARQAILQSIFDDDQSASQLWDLLDTPQTVDSLSRLLHEQRRDKITASLSKLIREDLIQLSPDS